MFNLFKKKKLRRMQDWEYKLLNSIIIKLPVKYSFLNDQVNKEFIVDSTPNEFLEKGWKRTICDQAKYDLFRISGVNYKLLGIEVFNERKKKIEVIELDIYDGILIGYKIDDWGDQYDIDRIDVSKIHEKAFLNKDKQELDVILGELDANLLSKLDLEDTFKIEVNENEFYVIKDFGDGNYLSIDKGGAIYGMIHDPYEIEKLFDCKDEFFNAIKSNNFSINEYYERKMS